jgi:predicted small metal-binding protein
MENEGPAVAMASEVLSFKCNDGGHPGCDWIVMGENEDLLIFQIEMHTQNNHNLVIDEGGKENIRNAITRGPREESVR